jgi:parallel beta-helix repeat protein
MSINQLTINRAIILAGIILFSMACIYPCSAADYAVVSRQMQSVQSAQTNQMLVTVTADPATYTPGSSLTIHVIVTLNQNPYPTSIPVQISASDSQITITPHSRATDSSGSFYATLTTTSSTSGVIHVQAQASDLYCGGVSAAPNQQCTVTSAVGSVDIPQQEQTKLQARVIYVSTTPTPVAYQPPENQPAVYQPPVQPQVNQPQQQAGNQPPVAVISVDKYAGNAGLTVNFDARKSYAPGGSIRTYSWNFGDGSSGNGYVAQHQYSIPGTYTASLVVTDNNELSSTPATTQITIWSSFAAPVYNVGGPCDDGNLCTVNDYYDNAGNCVAGQPLNCDDNNPNTVDSCNPAAQPITAGRVVNQGDTVYIGEYGLNIVNAVGGASRISWYDPNSVPGVSNPHYILEITPLLTNFYVAPNVFTGYTGTWYQGSTNVVAFQVASGPAVATGYPATGCVHTPITPVPPENPAAQPTAAPTPVPTSSVTQCWKITKPGHYILQNDIAANLASDKEACIEIVSSGITFDGNGKSITGQHIPQLKGISVSGSTTISNVAIENVHMSGWWAGISFENTNGGSISNCILDGNVVIGSETQFSGAGERARGVMIATSQNIEIIKNIIRNNDIGIIVESSHGQINIGKLPPCPSIEVQQDNSGAAPPQSYKNEILDNHWYGIWISSSDNNHIIGNTITGSWDGTHYTEPSGIFLDSSKNNEIISNSISHNYHSIYLGLDSTANNIFANTMTDNTDTDKYYKNPSAGYTENPVKTCEVVSQAPLMIAESQVHCTIIGFFTGQCGSDWTRVFTIFGVHPSAQPTPSSNGGTQQEKMVVQGAENQNEGIVAGIINFPSRTIQGLIGPSAGSQESQTTAKPVEQGGRPLPVICAGNGCLKPVANSNPGNPVSGLPEATISPTIPPASNCTRNLSCKNQICNCMCTDLNNDNANCGACGVTCPRGQPCSNGACSYQVRSLEDCKYGLTNCNGICVNLKSDPTNCGTCGNSCLTGQPCSNGVCIPEGELRR